MSKEKATWKDIKKRGSGHYKNPDDVEPIDLYKACGALKNFALCSIIKYAFRNLRKEQVSGKDMEKIKHYVDAIVIGIGVEEEL